LELGCGAGDWGSGGGAVVILGQCDQVGEVDDAVEGGVARAVPM
jgi:hypothetical protein